MRGFVLLAVGLWTRARADCPKGCPIKCPDQVSVQSDFVHHNLSMDKFWGTFYEIAFHDLTQPSHFPIEAKCQRSVKSPTTTGNYKDLFSLNEGYQAPGGKGINAICDLEFNITGSPGVFLGHWKSSSPWNPGLSDINNTVVDVGVAENGTYEWTLEFQCKEYDGKDAGKGIRFAAVNFYHRNPLISNETFNAMKDRLKARGLGWITELDGGLHMVDQKQCIDHGSYPAKDAAQNKWCGQGSNEEVKAEVNAEVAESSEGWCPDILKPICKFVNSTKCFASCTPRMTACIKDTECRTNLESFGVCMAKESAKNATADEIQACLVPDNKLRSEFIYCLMDGGDKGACVDVPVPPSTYPACADDSIAGDSNFNIKNLVGDWYKVAGWEKGELVECLPCQQVKFWPYSSPLPWPAPVPPVAEDALVISSSWYEQDSKGKYWPMNQTSVWGPRAGREGFKKGKDFSTGTMFGIGYKEEYTVVHDGSQEREPFTFMYACGETKQGKYVSGLVLAKQPTVSKALRARIDAVATKAGFVPGDWCNVDNSCHFSGTEAIVI